MSTVSNTTVGASHLLQSPHALVAGASGVIGRHIVAALREAGWQATGLSRKRPAWAAADTAWLQADMLDAPALRAACAGVDGLSHVFYCAFAPATASSSDWSTATDSNAAMCRNLLQAMAGQAALQRVLLVTGTKVYGTHLHPSRTPTPILETDPRHEGRNFYFDQADDLMAAAVDQGWTWTELRPHVLCGISPGTPMSLVTCLAVYGAVCAELGLPLHFPGNERAYDILYQVTDAELFGRGALWAATAAGAANEALHLHNGDPFRWRRVWPQVAAALGVPVGEPRDFALKDFMADKAPVWDAIVRRHALVPHRVDELAEWNFADYVLRTQWDIVTSMTKARLAGWHEVCDTGPMFARWFDTLRRQRLMPPRVLA